MADPREVLGRGWSFPFQLDAASGSVGLSEFEENIRQGITVIIGTNPGHRRDPEPDLHRLEQVTMPIRPPNLDDRRYEDILREARALIPQYSPEWTNLSDADPGMTLVQLFSWMTEMIIFRLNQVPDKT